METTTINEVMIQAAAEKKQKGILELEVIDVRSNGFLVRDKTSTIEAYVHKNGSIKSGDVIITDNYHVKSSDTLVIKKYRVVA